jgi:hypothetical protein
MESPTGSTPSEQTVLTGLQRVRRTAKEDKLLNRWVPLPTVQHPYPNIRFAVKHPRWEPYAGKPHVRFCPGGAS